MRSGSAGTDQLANLGGDLSPPLTWCTSCGGCNLETSVSGGQLWRGEGKWQVQTGEVGPVLAGGPLCLGAVAPARMQC